MSLKDLIQKISALEGEIQKAFTGLSVISDLQIFHQNYLGKKSPFNGLFSELKNCTPEEKKEIGPKLQQLKLNTETEFERLQSEMRQAEMNAQLAQDWIDVTKSLPANKGAIHPMSAIQQKVEQIFTGMGFEIADGPEVETEWHNFDALNIPPTHPARDMQDTFFVSSQASDSHKNSVLRTHTSNLQVRKMLEKGAPIRIIAPGRVFRNESIDATHDAMFYQVEGLMVDKDISIAHLKGVLEVMLSAVFEKEIKVRIRPGYFPFVEPGLEVDIWWEYTKDGQEYGRWLEFCGAGMVHPNVLSNSDVDPNEYQGFAFGFGLTRLVMMKYGIEDIRHLSSNKKAFLSQF